MSTQVDQQEPRFTAWYDPDGEDDLWFLQEDPNWDWKTKAVAAMLRDLYEDGEWRLSFEERKRLWEERGKELEAEGYIRLDEYSWGTPDILEGGEDDDEPYEPEGSSIIA